MKEKKPLEPWQQEDAQNLRRLFESRTETFADGKIISQMEFGAKYGIGSQGMVWQYLHARRPLNIKAAVAFAKGLNVKVSDFSSTLAAQIDDASRLEREPLELHVATESEEQQLQWVSGREAALLSAFRSCEHLQQQRILAIVSSIAGGDDAQGEGRVTRRDADEGLKRK